MIWLSFGVAMGAYMGVSGGGGGKGLPAEARAQALTVGFGYVVSLGVAGLLVHLVRASAPSSGFTASRRAAAQGLGGFLAAWPLIVVATSVATWVHTRVTGAEPDMIAHQTLRQLVDHPHDPWAWLLCGLAVVAAPLQEEIIYRGFLQSAVLRILGRPWIAVVLTSLVFAGVHTIGQSAVPWYAAVAIFTLSVCMGAAFERTRSLLAPIIMHMLFNGANVAMVAMGRTG